MARDVCRMMADLAAATGPELNQFLSKLGDDHWWPVYQAGKLAYMSIRACRKRLRSPLEDHMAVALYGWLVRYGIVPYDLRDGEGYPFADWIRETDRVGIALVEVRCNRRIKRAVFDFLLEGLGRKAVVECDSLAWHWGNAQERDHRKDEFAKELGYRMFRFPSKAILEDRDRCADQVLGYLVEGRS